MRKKKTRKTVLDKVIPYQSLSKFACLGRELFILRCCMYAEEQNN